MLIITLAGIMAVVAITAATADPVTFRFTATVFTGGEINGLRFSMVTS